MYHGFTVPCKMWTSALEAHLVVNLLINLSGGQALLCICLHRPLIESLSTSRLLPYTLTSILQHTVNCTYALGLSPAELPQ